MLTQKSYSFDVEIRDNRLDEWETIVSHPMTIYADDARCMPIVQATSTADIVEQYASDSLTPSLAFLEMVDTICDAFDVDSSSLDEIYIPTAKIRNKVTSKANLHTDGRWIETRIGKRGTRMTYVGKRLTLDGELTDSTSGYDIPCTAMGVLRPFHTIGIEDVWHIMRDSFSRLMADIYNADVRHVRITMRYTGSMDIRG